jgi:3-deoxy-manno-octulosonate cytidylyltransferase (CMP-KDO synthetase)
MKKPHQAPQRPIILIPARMGSKRLPGKPLLDIAGEPMIVQVWRRAMESKVGPVVVACDGEDIAAAVKKAGGEAVITDPKHPSGSDRIWEALNALEKKAGGEPFDAVLNVQGDLPTLDPKAIRTAYELLKDPDVDIATLAVPIQEAAHKQAPQIVKAVVELPEGKKQGRALYFSRAPVPGGEGPYYHHIGLYAYQREALATFVAAKPATLEKRESLEQLRALALGMHIAVAIIATEPLGVDTPADLEEARALLRKT